MSIVFFGTPDFALPTLKALIDSREDIRLVVTQPDKKKGRGHLISAPPIKDLAISFGIPLLQPSKINDDDFIQIINNIKPEFIIVVAYGKLLPQKILSIPTKGCINVHASILPKYRGAAPIQWALIKGELVTGVTTILMDEGLDTGDKLLQMTIDIEESDNSETLSKKLSQIGSIVLIESLKGLRDGSIHPSPQVGEVSYAPPLKKTDGKIIWNKEARELFNFIRAMYPWPSAFTYLNNERIKVIKAKHLDGEGIAGRIEKASEGKLIVGTGKGLLLIEELQPEGKKIMDAAAFLTGRKLRECQDAFV